MFRTKQSTTLKSDSLNLLLLNNTVLEKQIVTLYILPISFIFQPPAFKLLCPLLTWSNGNISIQITNGLAANQIAILF